MYEAGAEQFQEFRRGFGCAAALPFLTHRQERSLEDTEPLLNCWRRSRGIRQRKERSVCDQPRTQSTPCLEIYAFYLLMYILILPGGKMLTSSALIASLLI
jgi:hypothetical protein